MSTDRFSPTRRAAVPTRGEAGSWGRLVLLVVAVLSAVTAHADYVNFESGHVHPIALTPSGNRLLVVNTPDAVVEVYAVQGDGSLIYERSVAVGLEPVTVAARLDGEAWAVNNLSDTISIFDPAVGVVTRTLEVGDEPTDVVFAAGKAFVAVSQLDQVRVFDTTNLNTAPTIVPLFSRDIRALAVSNSGGTVYAVALRSGNQTTAVNANVIFGPNNSNLNAQRLSALGLSDMNCDSGLPPAYPPLPAGIARNPALTDPPPGTPPPVSLIVGWDEGSGRWVDEIGQDWSHCLPFRLPDHDLFAIDTSTLVVTTVDHLGTALFDVSVHPTNNRIYVANTDSRNQVRFEHALGVRGHVVDNRFSVVDPAAGNSVNLIDLNAHISRASDPATNLAERSASISQPGMLAWKSDGSVGYLTAIGSRKLFRVDGTCTSAACIFGASRATPDAVEVGEGPTGVVLAEAKDRLYVLNRISHSLALVEASSMTLVEEIPLHDPSSVATRDGRRFLYDGIDSSAHGDSACASCHLFGDMDGLAWDLGDPAGTMVPYTTPMDNVRFVVPQNGEPVDCDPNLCAAHDGFDPQKGPMATQTLRGMLEPLHWRGDRATMNDFNAAFVGLMGTADIGPINGKPAGLSAVDMEKFRQFALEVTFPPNPLRNVDDTLPCGPRATDPSCEVLPHGSLFSGNPTEGALMFDTHPSDAGQPCVSCHTHPFGAAGGQLGGLTPTEPTAAVAPALFFGTADGSAHSDLKIPHLRNMYDKFGPTWAAPAGSPPDARVGFGLAHDGTVPDLFRFFSSNVFTLSDSNQAQEVRDTVSFMFHFPTETRPSVGRQVTVPQGTAPTGTVAEEALIATLLGLGDGADGARHCELVVVTNHQGRSRRFQYASSLWVTDVAADPPMTTAALRAVAEDALTFTCTPIGSGPRLGGDRDEDARLDGDDCAPADPTTFEMPASIGDLTLSGGSTTSLGWSDQVAATGASLRYEILGGTLSDGIPSSTCLVPPVVAASWLDPRPDPASGEGYFYLVRATNPCGSGGQGAGRDSLDALTCPAM